MKCDRCKTNIEKGEERKLHGQILCEDCYMDALSPARPCDPWAVYTTKSLSEKVDELQAKILKILEETGPKEPDALAQVNVELTYTKIIFWRLIHET